MSIRAWLVRRKIRSVFRPSSLRGAAADKRLRHFDQALQAMERNLPGAPAEAEIEAVDVGDVRGEWVTMPGANPNRVLLYSHGGGYVWGGPKPYRDLGARLSSSLRARVFLLDYRLAPAHKCPAPIEDALAAYDWIREQHPRAAITLAGDSAGGGLTLATAHAIRDSGRAQPSAIALVSPWLDVTGAADSLRRNAKKEVMLDPDGIAVAGKQYRGDLAADDPRCSPLFGSQSNLPPVLIQVGAGEILLDDSVHVADKIRTAGGEVKLDVWRKMHHVWHFSAGIVPEGRRAINDIATYFDKHWGV